MSELIREEAPSKPISRLFAQEDEPIEDRCSPEDETEAHWQKLEHLKDEEETTQIAPFSHYLPSEGEPLMENTVQAETR